MTSAEAKMSVLRGELPQRATVGDTRRVCLLVFVVGESASEPAHVRGEVRKIKNGQRVVETPKISRRLWLRKYVS
jgi:hypothetical protein